LLEDLLGKSGPAMNRSSSLNSQRMVSSYTPMSKVSRIGFCDQFWKITNENSIVPISIIACRQAL